MSPVITYILSGFIFGLSGGLSPGPLLTLVVSETLKHGIKEGIKISIAPLFTDLPIVFASIFLLSHLSNILPLLGLISLLGGIFIAYLGYRSVTFKGTEINNDWVKPKSVRKGIIANLLNPSPYMFWFTIGAPMVLKALNEGILPAFAFMVVFYFFLIGSKVAIAVIIGKSRTFLKSNHYVYAIRLLGVILFLFSILFLKDSLKYFNVL